MTNSGRYFICPAVTKPAGQRVTLMQRIRKWRYLRNLERPDVFRVTGVESSCYPSGAFGAKK